MEKRQIIMQRLLAALNGSAAQPDWAGTCDGHYIFLWKRRTLRMKKYKYINCGINEHPWRTAQYMQFQDPDIPNGLTLHVIHCHSPSGSRCILTSERRKRIFKHLWDHVLRNDGGGSAAQPPTIFGGDFNCKPLEWTY